MEIRWYHDPRLLKAAYERYGTFEAAAAALGGADHTTLARWWHKHSLGTLPKGPKPIDSNNEALMELHEFVYGSGGASFEQIR